MSSKSRFCGIYDFELMPYALGDALTWNVQSAMHCAESGREQVDLYICMDRKQPASIYQRGLVVPDNCDLYFSELFGAFNTHPMLGDLHLFGSQDDFLDSLRSVSRGDPVTSEIVARYEEVLSRREDENALNAYFIENVYSHERLNRYLAAHGHIPLLSPSRGCEPDVDGLIAAFRATNASSSFIRVCGEYDFGLGGDHTYHRDSDFLEWYEFVRMAGKQHPEVQFVVLGRLQEKPIELLRLPNVTSLRALGLGLGHELTLILKADLFIGTSSEYAAMANFSTVPSLITKMSKESCKAYDIPNGATRLPFAAPNQVLVYENETSAMLMGLLEQGLAVAPRRPAEERASRSVDIGVKNYEEERARTLYKSATTNRFFVDDTAADQETVYLTWPKMVEGFTATSRGDFDQAQMIVRRIADSFPRLRGRSVELEKLAAGTKLPVSQRVKLALRRRLRGIDGRMLPAALVGTRFHALARQIKHALLK